MWPTAISPKAQLPIREMRLLYTFVKKGEQVMNGADGIKSRAVAPLPLVIIVLACSFRSLRRLAHRSVLIVYCTLPKVKMLVKDIAARALLGAIALPSPDMMMSPNPAAGLVVRQSGGCDPGEVACVDGCMPSGSVCCTSRGTYCTAGNYCMAVSGCCPVCTICLLPDPPPRSVPRTQR